MPSTRVKRIRLFLTLGIFLSLIAATVVAIQFAKGYRPNREGQLNGMGLLSATSYPNAAQVLVNDKLTTATDGTIYLLPNTYTIKIIKDGFTPWTKTIPVARELVSATDARLFPSLPSINPLTYSGVINATVSPDSTKIAFVANKGLFILSLNNSLSSNFLGNTQLIQLTDNTTLDYSKAKLYWSPNSTEVLAILPNLSYLFNTKGVNKSKDLVDVSARLTSLLQQWKDQLILVNQSNLKLLPDYMATVLNQNAVNVYFSPDQEKVLYTITKDIKLPDNPLKNTLPSLNPTSQIRDLKQGDIYVFDIKEGTNYLIETGPKDFTLTKVDLTASPSATPTPAPTPSLTDSFDQLATQTNPLLVGNLTWYSTSRHIFIIAPDQIEVAEYDGNNRTTIFQTNVVNSLVVPSSDGHRLIVLTNLNQKNTPPNFFSIDLK